MPATGWSEWGTCINARPSDHSRIQKPSTSRQSNMALSFRQSNGLENLHIDGCRDVGKGWGCNSTDSSSTPPTLPLSQLPSLPTLNDYPKIWMHEALHCHTAARGPLRPQRANKGQRMVKSFLRLLRQGCSRFVFSLILSKLRSRLIPRPLVFTANRGKKKKNLKTRPGVSSLLRKDPLSHISYAGGLFCLPRAILFPYFSHNAPLCMAFISCDIMVMHFNVLSFIAESSQLHAKNPDQVNICSRWAI